MECPPPQEALVIVTGGQSNAANSISLPYSAGEQVTVWFEGKCYPAEDPLLGANGGAGSLWSLLGDRVAAKVGRPVLLINGGIGGSQYADWNDQRSGYLAALLRRIETARAAGFETDLVLWHQGETDALVERNRKVVASELTQLSGRILQSLPQGASLYMFQASKCVGAERANGLEDIRQIQAAVAAGNPQIVLGMNTDLLGNDFRWDTCHFNSLGRTAIVEHILPEVVGMLVTHNGH